MCQRNKTKHKLKLNDASRNLHAQNITGNRRFPRIYPFIITISLIPVLFMLLELYLSQSQYSSSNTLLFQDLFVDNNTDTADTNSEQYLLYFSHSGFSNQLRGLQGAASLALVTNRTLVLPPLLPHSSTDRKTLSYPQFRARAAGDNCRAWRYYSQFQKWVHGDVIKSHGHWPALPFLSTSTSTTPAFPSYKALIDVDALVAQSTGLKIIAMPEFANERKGNTNYNNWCKGDSTLRDKMVNGCGDKAGFSEMVSAFLKSCGRAGGDSGKNRNMNGGRIAVIGSGFVLPIIKSNADYFGETVGRFFLSTSLQSRVFIIVKGDVRPASEWICRCSHSV